MHNRNQASGRNGDWFSAEEEGKCIIFFYGEKAAFLDTLFQIFTAPDKSVHFDSVYKAENGRTKSFKMKRQFLRHQFIWYFIFLVQYFGFAQEMKLVLNKPFDLSNIYQFESGPKNHIYALNEENQLALIRFDTVKQGDSIRLNHKIIKVIELSLWNTGQEKIKTNIYIQAVSEDGKYLALKIVKLEENLKRSLKTSIADILSEEICIFNFQKEAIETIVKTENYLSQGAFKGYIFYYGDQKYSFFGSAEVTTYSYDLKTGKTRKEPDNTIWGLGKKSNFDGFNVNLQTTSHGSCLNFKSGIEAVSSGDSIIISKSGRILKIVPYRDSLYPIFSGIGENILIRRKRDKTSSKSLFYHYRTNQVYEVPYKYAGAACTLNNNSLVYLNAGGSSRFNVYNFVDGIQLIREEKSKDFSEGNEWIINRKKTNKIGLLFSNRNMLLEADVENRVFSFINTGSGFDSTDFHFPCSSSNNFKLNFSENISRFSYREKGRKIKRPWMEEELFVNGKNIGVFRSYSGSTKAKNTRLKTDIPNNDSYLLIGNNQEIFSYSGKGKRNWLSSCSYIWAGKSGSVRAIKADENSHSFKTYSSDNLIDFWNAGNGKKYLSLYLDTASMDWVLFTPSGYYDCSPGGEKLIGWSVSRGTDSLPAYYSGASFRSSFYRPDLLDSVIHHLDEEISLSRLNLGSGKQQIREVEKNLPPVIQIISPGINDFFSDTIVKIQYSIFKGSSPVHTIKIYLDGRPLQVLPAPRGNADILVKIPGRDCNLGIAAVSASGESEMDIRHLIWKGESQSALVFRKPDLFILAIGVGKYKNPDLKLDFPVMDASDFCQFFKGQDGGLYNTIHIRLLSDSLASKQGIQDGLEWLEKNVSSKDVSMIFMAGHGENDNNNNFYFLPWEADPERMKSTCIPYFDFKSTILALPGKVLVFLDACRSGNIFGDLNRRSLNSDWLARELASGNGGAIVFTSSCRKQASVEDPRWQNGAFTEALMEGLNGKADLMEDGYVTVKALDLFVSRRVKELTQNRQIPQTIVPQSISDFALAIKTKAEKK